MTNEEYNLYLAQISSALIDCKKCGYATKKVNATIALIKAFYDRLSDQNQKQSLLNGLKKLREKADKAIEERKKSGVVTTANKTSNVNLNDVFPSVDCVHLEERPFYDVRVIESIMSHADNTIVLYNPLKSELLHAVNCYAQKFGYNLRIVDCNEFVQNFSEADSLDLILKLYDVTRAHLNKELIVYVNTQLLKAVPVVFRNFCYYVNEMKRPGLDDSLNDVEYAEVIQQIILNTDGNFRFECEFREAMKSFGKDTTGVFGMQGEVTCTFLPMPSFAMIHGEICKYLKLDADDGEIKEFIKKQGVALGYAGLNDLLAGANADNWRELLIKLTETKTQDFNKFVSKLDREVEKLLTADWGFEIPRDRETIGDTEIHIGDLSADVKFVLPDNELYDVMVDGSVIRKNMQRILDSDFTPIQKCGWAINYALDNGDSMNIINLDESNRETILKERWEIAYDALSQLMHIPRGTLSFDIYPDKEPNLWGQCCRGGELIRMNVKYVNTSDPKVIQEGCDTLLHELFHALQHSCMRALPMDKRSKTLNSDQADEFALSYYFKYFNVTVSRIYQWSVNEDRYHRSDDGFVYYYDQVFEADARIYAADVLDCFANLNPPQLD